MLGYRVLDLTDARGMFCTALLARMGAEVTRIMSPGAAEDERYAYLNAGKNSVKVDITTPEGRDLFLDLAAAADILVESYPPGYLASLGLGHDRLAEMNPRLIMASITDFGQDGPYRDFKSCDLVAGALGGWLSVTGLPDSPLKPFGEQAYRTASLFAANGILLALWRRHETGRGQHVDISIMECVAATLDHVLVRYFYEGEVPGRRGARHWNDAFAVFPCRDGYVLLSVFREWETLVEWLASEGMAADLADPKWRDRGARQAGVDHIIDVLKKWTLTHTAAEIVETGQLMRFPWAKVVSVPELRRSPQLAARGFFSNKLL
jgi:crotonobetainyl-CoA:carnitine CoA-transferase CaiB-like acyl-CoA transferase